MPSRKATPSPSAGREEAPKKKAKHTHSPFLSSPSSGVNALAASGTFDFQLTADERQFLSTQLAQFSTTSAEKTTAPVADLSSSAWMTTLLPAIAGITEKVLKAAAEQYALAHSACNVVDEEGMLSVTASSPPAGTPEQFAEENTYILEQLTQLQWTPFTYQRILEILANPCGTCRCVRSSAVTSPSQSKSVLRGDVLQAALRRCILVNYPFTGECDRNA